MKNEYIVVATSQQTNSVNTLLLDINNINQVNCVFAEVNPDIVPFLATMSSLASTTVKPKLKRTRIGDFLNVFEQKYGITAKRIETRSFNNLNDYLVSGEGAIYTQTAHWGEDTFYVTDNPLVNVFKEGLFTQNNTSKLSDEKITS